MMSTPGNVGFVLVVSIIILIEHFKLKAKREAKNASLTPSTLINQ